MNTTLRPGDILTWEPDPDASESELEALQRELSRHRTKNLELQLLAAQRSARAAEARWRVQEYAGHRVVLHARGSPVPSAEDFGRVMYMPAGVHRIHCGLGQQAYADVVVMVDKDTARALGENLEALNAEEAPQRALFDKEHEHGEAMAWPTGFEWADTPEPGVYARLEWSSLGRQYVEGKVVRAFSGSFFTDADLPKRAAIKAGQTYTPAKGKRGSAENPARIVGLDFPYAGSFTNNPAFRQILPLWAKARPVKAQVRVAGGQASIVYEREI